MLPWKFSFFILTSRKGPQLHYRPPSWFQGLQEGQFYPLCETLMKTGAQSDAFLYLKLRAKSGISKKVWILETD